MSESELIERCIQTALATVPDPKSVAVPANPAATAKAALKRCCGAWQRAYQAYLRANGRDDVDMIFAAKEGGIAFCNAMPMLVGHQGVRDFIACAAHGILVGAIEPARSGHLLYAAQLALQTAIAEPKSASPSPTRQKPAASRRTSRAKR